MRPSIVDAAYPLQAAAHETTSRAGPATQPHDEGALACLTWVLQQHEKLLRFEQSPPSALTSLRPLQQIPPHPRDSHRPFWTLSQTGELLWRDTGGIRWRKLASRLDNYWPDTRQDPPARDTQRDPLASYSGILSGILGGIHRRAAGGIHWRATLAGILGGIHWRATLGYSAGYSAGSTGELLWRDTGRNPLASCSGGILSGIHWRAALAGYWAGSTGGQLWQDTGRDPLASCSGGILGGIHWRAALAGYLVEACRSIANADSDIKSNNPFLSGGE